MWVCRQELQWSNDGLNETENWRIRRRTGRVEFCGTWSWVDRTGHRLKRTSLWQCSLKLKKSSVTVQLTVFECRSQELRWVLRGISLFITQRTVFRSDLRISRDNYVVNLMPPLFESCRVPGDIHYIHDVMQPGSNHALHVQPSPACGIWLWTYSRVELESCHFFSIYCLNEVFRWQRISWPMLYKRQPLSTKLALKTHWLIMSQFSWSWIFFISSFL